MKKDLTEPVFILDRSGSMQGLESDTIGGFNSMLEKQKKEPGEAFVSTVLFDDRAEVLHDRVKLDEVKPITDKEYYVRGCTAQRVKEMIQRQKEKYGWDFPFLGANIDAVETAGHLGIAPSRAVNYHCDSDGTRLNYEVVGRAVAFARASVPLAEHWKDEIEADFRRRNKGEQRAPIISAWHRL